MILRCSPCLRGHHNLCTTPTCECTHEGGTDPEGERGMEFFAVHCVGGWNVHGHGDDKIIPSFECLHLHVDRASALVCKQKCATDPAYLARAAAFYAAFTAADDPQRKEMLTGVRSGTTEEEDSHGRGA